MTVWEVQVIYNLLHELGQSRIAENVEEEKKLIIATDHANL
jgi:hypothetical protein